MWDNTPQSMRGILSKRAGEHFEGLIEASLMSYELNGVACIEKTPEPMKPLRPPNKQGQFLACFTKAAQPDYKGTLSGGRSVVFEAKHTDADRIKQERVTKEQSDRLELHHKLGAVAFVLVSFGLQDFYRIPWKVWRDMKSIYGRKYVTQTDIERYRVPFKVGVIRILDDVCIDEKAEAMLEHGICPDICVICGRYVPEGAHVCSECKKKGGAGK